MTRRGRERIRRQEKSPERMHRQPRKGGAQVQLMEAVWEDPRREEIQMRWEAKVMEVRAVRKGIRPEAIPPLEKGDFSRFNVRVKLDGREQMVMVDSGADYSII